MKEEYIEFLLSRRSIRKFKPEKVPLEVLERIVDVARQAPSARNAQPWEFIIITDKDTIDKLGKVSRAASPLLNAPAAIAVVSDPQTSPVTHQVDGALATLYAWLAIHALGLGAVWINSLRYEEMKEILGVPKEKVLLAILAVGYPDEQPKVKPRKPLKEVLHYERYGNRERPA